MGSPGKDGMQAPTSGERIGYLEQYFDPRLILPKKANPQIWEGAQIERLGRALAIVLVAGAIPRRLGGDATRDELALDKKRAKRVTHALRAALFSWAKDSTELPAGDEIQIAGAQINWEVFTDLHLVEARAELLSIASWAIKHEERRWGRTVVTRIENEMKWMRHAMRD